MDFETQDFHYIYHHVQSCGVHASREVHSPYFYSTPTCTMCLQHSNSIGGQINEDQFVVFGKSAPMVCCVQLNASRPIVTLLEDAVRTNKRTKYYGQCYCFYCVSTHQDEERKLQSQKGCRKKIITSLKIVYHGELQAINLDIVCQQYLLGQ
jgi:hypothetical protein